LKTRFFTLLILFFIAGVTTFGQMVRVKNDPTHDEKRIHFGFSLGVNFMDYQIKQSQFSKDSSYYVGIKELKPGINIHAISNLRLSENFDLRCLPGISFGNRQLYFLNRNNTSMYSDSAYQMQSSYLELPFTFKYKSKREYNFRPFLVGGVNLRYDLAVKREYDYKEQLIMIKPFDIYTEFGGGVDFYLTYFKFAIEFKYCVGMTDIFRTTNPAGQPFSENPRYTNMIDEIKSNIFVISFHFE
jgi:hypothetical protein